MNYEGVCTPATQGLLNMSLGEKQIRGDKIFKDKIYKSKKVIHNKFTWFLVCAEVTRKRDDLHVWKNVQHSGITEKHH